MIDDDCIQFNKFANFHDGEKVFFCKIDYLISCFEKIKKINNEVFLITGNSDYGIYQYENKIIIKDLNGNISSSFNLSEVPSNIKLWFSSNNCTNFEFIKTLPIGLENDYECKLVGNGKGFDFAKEKISLLISESKTKDFEIIDKSIYLNCNESTNFNIRSKIKEHCKNIGIYVEDTKLSYEKFYKKCKEFKAIICPSGNGLDTHRFYEVLMLNRVPILVKVDKSKIYEEFYSKFPCIILNNLDELEDPILNSLIAYKLYNMNNEMSTFTFWHKYVSNLVSNK